MLMLRMRRLSNGTKCATYMTMAIYDNDNDVDAGNEEANGTI